jgi:hypothetical protein
VDDILHLEFACTPAEIKEAQELIVRHRIAGGSRWLMYAIIAMALLTILFSFYQRINAFDRPWMFGLAAAIVIPAIAIALFVEKRKLSRSAKPIIVEIMRSGLRIGDSRTLSNISWTAFGRLVESESLFVLPDRSGTTLFVIPKRVFSDASDCEWFRDTVQSLQAVDEALGRTDTHAASTCFSEDPEGITGEFRLGLTDSVDRTLASWKTRLAMAGIGTIFLLTLASVILNPPPNAKRTIADALYFFLPTLIGFELLLFLFFTLRGWVALRRHSSTQKVTLREGGILWTDNDGDSDLPWTPEMRYKETSRSIFIWRSDTGVWIQLPKSSIPTRDGIERCRDILRRKCTASTWYFG